jgi:NAD(P)-dependent dehydrogenase (short-subunit alcohol dehydrogenase family)
VQQIGEALVIKQIAIVTGAGSGIGRAIATSLAIEGYHVALIGRNRERLEETLELIKRNQGSGSIHVGDVTQSNEVTQIFEEISKLTGEVAILVNNAGHLLVKPIMETTEADVRALFDVHVMATFLCTQKAVPLMQKNRYGRIINIVSAMGQGASEFTSHYQLAKAAQHSFTKSCAIAFRKDGITANSVSPTTIDTEVFHSNDVNYKKYLGHSAADELAQRKTSTPKGLISAEEVARAVLFFSSPESGNITGEVISI